MKNKQDALVALSVIACAMVLLGALVFAIAGNPFKKADLSFTVDFKNVAGISPHSAVFYAGDKIGVVDQLEQLAPGDRLDPDHIVRLHISILKDLTLPSHINIFITSDSMLGERYVALERIDDEGKPLQNDAHLLASNPKSMIESMIPGGTEIIDNMGEITTNLKTITDSLASGKNGKNFTATVANLKDVTGDLKVMLRGEGEDAEGLKTKLAAIADNLKTLTADLKELISGPEDEPAKGLKTRADGMLTNLEEFSQELKLTMTGTEGEPGLRIKINTIADEVNTLLAGAEGEAGMRERLNQVMTRLDGVLLEIQAFIVWGEYVTGTLAEKPNRLIFGSKKNDVPTKEQIIDYLQNNETPYPVIIKANSPQGDPQSIPPPEDAMPSPPIPPPTTGDDPPPKASGGFFNNLFQRKK